MLTSRRRRRRGCSRNTWIHLDQQQQQQHPASEEGGQDETKFPASAWPLATKQTLPRVTLKLPFSLHVHEPHILGPSLILRDRKFRHIQWLAGWLAG